VKTGQIVARLDPSVYASQLEAARGQLAQAQAEASQMQTTLDDANRKLGRAEELAAQGLITQAELDDARTVMRQAAADLKGRQASIQSAQAGVKQAQVDLERTVVRSPIDGIVVNRNVDVGQTVAATLQSPVLFTIADVRSMHLLTEVNEGEVGGVKQGSDVSFQVESLGTRTFHGKVTEVRLQPYADQAGAIVAVAATGTGAGGSGTATGTGGGATGGTATTGNATPANATAANATSASGSSGTTVTAPGAVTYTAVVDVRNEDGRLAPGGTAIVTLSGGSRQGVVRLPNNALSFRPSPAMLERTGQSDLVVTTGAGSEPTGDRNARVSQVWRFERNRFVPVDVVTGLSDDRWTEMVSGAVQPGDQLVTSAAAAR
jgi:multidrug efflux pump subunit AcrA (membrane-fusion protein)